MVSFQIGRLAIGLKSTGKRAKGKNGFMRYQSIIDHPFMSKECHNNKVGLVCFFLDFRKVFDTIPWDKLWKIIDEIMIPTEFKIIVIYLYEMVVPRLIPARGGLNILNEI